MQKHETKQTDLNNNDLRVILLESIKRLNPSSWRGRWVAYTWKHIYPTSAPLLLTLLKSVNGTINREHGGVVYRYGKKNGKGRSVYYVRKEEWEHYLKLLEYYLFEYDGSLNNTDFVNPLPLPNP
jgi:hypothetical protein